MTLTDPERREVWAKLMRERACPATVDKPDFRAAVDAVDAWADANAVSFNSALPLPYRNAADSDQKAILMAGVMLRRAGVL
jgi:hypothetical protein